MGLYTTLCIVILGTCLSSFLLPYECKKLDGYEFPVYSTELCPRNQEEWNLRSSAINCTNTNGYMCLPNDNLTEVLEFCYIYPRMLIQKDLCLYLVKRYSRVNSYNCSNFKYGCPEDNYFSSKIFQYPSCIHVENGCFFAEPSCRSITTTYAQQTTDFKLTGGIQENITVTFYHESTEQIQNENDRDGIVLVATLYGVLLFIVFFCSLCLYFRIRKKYQILNRRSEREELLFEYEPTVFSKVSECRTEKSIIDQWKQDDSNFISTKACKEVENKVKNRNLVIVAGHSGSGKSAIIQHIALKYREQGWTVKRVRKVKAIVDEYSPRFQKYKTICVFNDPLGKESFDEVLNHSWQSYEAKIELYLKTAKLVMSSRSHIISDARVTRYLVKHSQIVNIDDNKYKLSVEEKRQILNKYTSDINLSKKECDVIVDEDSYFPLLCKLYSSEEKCKNRDIRFFAEPLTVLRDEILGFRKKDKGKYCALALLTLFNNELCASDLLKNKDTEYKFRKTLNLCGLPENTPPSAIEESLNTLKAFFVKKVGDTYHFYHDFVMKVTTHVFGTDYPAETIMYADIGFLRQRVRLEGCEEHYDPFTIYISDRYIEELVERLFTELFGHCLIDVVLNPCLKKKKVTEALKKVIKNNEKKIPMLLKKKELKLNKMQKYYHSIKTLHMSKLAFIGLENDISPLSVLIVLSHTDLSLEIIHTLQQMHVNFNSSSLLPAVYCNGSMELFDMFSKDCVRKSLNLFNDWGGFYPIHIVSIFHNYKILEKLIMIGTKVNLKSHTWDHWTPLLLAAGIDTQEYENYDHEESRVTRRDKTVKLLLSYGADINLCEKHGASPLYIACERGHDSTVQLLLRSEANINLCEKHGASPLYIACKKGNDSIVQLLLSNGADIQLCMEDGTSPLYIACQNGHDSTVQLLLRSRADINLCKEDGASPLYIACQHGYDSTVQLLLTNGADIDLCEIHGFSPLYAACVNGHFNTAQHLLYNGADINSCKWDDGASPLSLSCQSGNYSIVQLLLCNGADINLCKRNGASPLNIACQSGHYSIVQLLLSTGADINLCLDNGTSLLNIACQNGYNNIVQLLLDNGADINLFDEDGASPLYIACQNGHEITVQLLLRKGACINLCLDNGASPLYIACRNGHKSIVQLLLDNGADINLCDDDGASPLYIACRNRHDSTVQLLLRNEANINLCEVNGASPLFVACFDGHDSTVQLLLNNGADINLCLDNGISPLYIACQNGYDRTVQLLLSNGANINLCMRDGVSPLYLAFEKRRYKTVNILLKNGADTSLACGWKVNPDLVDFVEEQDSTVVFLQRKDNISNNMYDPDSYFSLFVSCQMQRVTRMIL